MKPCLPAHLLSIFLAAAFPLHAQDDPPLKAGDKVCLKIRRAAESEDNTILKYLEVDDSGRITVPGLNTRMEVKGLTSAKLAESITAAFRTEEQSNPFIVAAMPLPGSTGERIWPGTFLRIEAAEPMPANNSYYIVSKTGHIQMPGLRQPVSAGVRPPKHVTGKLAV